MNKKSFEETQSGNPHQLTINQHVFPRRSIERFVSIDKMVCVYSKTKKKYLRVHPNDEIFFTRRTWNQRAESGWMRDIEDKFQALANAIIDGNINEINAEEARKISDLWILWHLRSKYKGSPLSDAKLNVIAADPAINKDQQEYLEKNFIGCIRNDATISGRDVAGDQMQLRLFAVRKQLANERWRIVRAQEGEFIVPDIFLKDSKALHVVPLTPTICLMSCNENALIGLEDVKRINKLAVEYSHDFYFAQDFSKCPV